MAEVQPSAEVAKWLGHIAAYDGEFKKWRARADKVVKRYRDEDRATRASSDQARFNILWSNVQTLTPAVYAKLPTADVSRRFGDNDPVGRVASMLLERALDFEIEHYADFRSAMKNCVEDRLLPGRGVAWVRYEPHVVSQDMPEDGLEITEDADEAEQPQGDEQGPPEVIEYECAPTDYVHWKDFGHTVARTWEEVTGVWRWVFMGKDAVKERFGPEIADKVQYNSSPEAQTKYGQGNRTNDKARIAEIWDKDAGEVLWLHEACPGLLDRRPDPLKLEGFFPCPKPLYATLTSDCLIPIPDFVLYQDQAKELDTLADRVDGLIDALRVRGVYDASQPALQRLLTEGENNILIPNDKWAGFSEKGGLKGSIDLLDLSMVVEALSAAYQAQENVKSQIYEITGISDIVRGQTAASETATAQQIKGQYVGLRLKSMQDGVALFASELLRLKAQIICTQYQPETILAYAAADQMSEADKQLIPQAIQLLRNKPLRNFRVEVAADSLVQLDENQVKQDRTEFLTAFAGFMKEALPAGQQMPELTPMLMEVLKFGVGAFKQAKPIEGAIDQALQKLAQAQAQAQANPKPSPEQIKAQADLQKEQFRAQADQQIEQIRGQVEVQVQQMKLNHEAQLSAMENRMDANFQAWKAELDAATKVMVALLNAKMSPEGSVGLDIAEQMDEIIPALGQTMPNGGGNASL